MSAPSLNPALGIGYRPVPGVLGISPHGLLAAVGIFVGYWVLRRLTRRNDLPWDVLERAILWAIPAGIVGARADFVLSHPGQFDSVGSVLQIWNGGLALFGGLIVAITVALLVLHHNHLPLRLVLDLAAPAIALAIGIGRVGDLLLTDHLGKPTTSAFALAYRVPFGADLAPGFGPSPARPPGVGESCADVGRFFAGCSYHLTPAYDLVGALILAAFLWWLLVRRPHPEGAVFALFVIGYATQRLMTDATRAVDERPLWGMTGTQLAAFVLALAGVACIGWLYTRDRSLRCAPRRLT
ncbi:prolipoprotein diacylglyceryl transferase [Flexivirga lutea]